MPSGRKSKYTPDTVSLIVEVIEQTGKDECGYRAGGITYNTFYRWLKEKGEFSQSIGAARAVFRKNRPQSLRSAAVKKLADIIHNGQVETWEKVSVTKDGQGKVISTTKSISKANKGTPEWALNRVLGKDMPVLEAVQVLLAEGIATPSMAAVVESSIDEMQRKLRELNETDAERSKLEQLVSADGTGKS